MPVPKFIASVNKKFFNPMEMKKGKRPYLTHVGRVSGQTYFTPLDAHRVDGGFIFVVMYGADSDWVQNILTAGTATVRKDGEDYSLVNPRVIGTDEAFSLLEEGLKPPPGYLKVTEYLHMDIAPDGAV